MQSAIEVSSLEKTYASGFQALKPLDLTIRRGEIFALLGPNGAGKTTLISIICGIVNPTGGRVLVEGHDILTEPRRTRSLIGLVPQELTTDAFETVWDTVSFSRGLFGRPADPGHVERVLRDLSLWDKRSSKIMALSGGMKRRLIIARELLHRPKILLLDEPTAGLSPLAAHELFSYIRRIADEGIAILMVEQNALEALGVSDRAYVLVDGRNHLDGPAQAVANDPDIRRLFLGGRATNPTSPDKNAGLLRH